MADQHNFYNMLGVARDAPADEIQRAYRKLARTYHPDLNKDPEAEGRFKEIAEAYEVLSDPATKKKYDAFGADFRGVPDDVDPDMWRQAQRARASGRGPRAGGGVPPGWDANFSGGGDADYASRFEDLFGQGVRGRAGWGPIPGADHEAEITVSVDDAYRGGRRSFTLSGPEGDRTFDVNVPPGVIDGQKIRLGGQGGRGTEGAKSGDLYLVVHVTPDPTYRLDGRDVYVDLKLTPSEAALGTTTSVDTPGGPVSVKVAPGTSTGKKLRLRGRGMPSQKGTAGDLYANVQVAVPSTLSDDEQRLYEELAAASNFDPRRAS